MLIDTGSQISLINNKSIPNKALINTQNKIKISSIHGSENTLGEISANIHKDNTTIPIQLQVTKNSFLKEDGIIGYDVLGGKAIINGPTNTVTINSGNSKLVFPIKTNKRQDNRVTNITEEIDQFNIINYLSEEEINPQYKINLRKVQSITEEISPTKIQIKPTKLSQDE